MSPTQILDQKTISGWVLSNTMRYLIFLLMTVMLFVIAVAHSEPTEDWTLLTEKDNIRIFKKNTVRKSEIPFKTEAEIDGSVEEVLNIIMELERKSEWAPKCLKAAVIKKYSDFKYFFMERYSAPWPIKDREFFLLCHIIIKNRDEVLIKAHSIDPQGLTDPSCVTGEVSSMTITLTRLPGNRTHMVFTLQGDLKGWLPNWLDNMVERDWPLNFMQGLRAQLKKNDVKWCARFKAIADKLRM